MALPYCVWHFPFLLVSKYQKRYKVWKYYFQLYSARSCIICAVKKKVSWLIFFHSWTWSHVSFLKLKYAFWQCENCLISTHFIHHTWKRPDQDAPGSPAGIWGDLRELDWLSASEGIFSVGVMGGGSVEAQLDLSTARHVTPRRNPLTSLQGWCWSA